MILRQAQVRWDTILNVKYEEANLNFSPGTALHYFCAINFVEGIEALLQVIIS